MLDLAARLECGGIGWLGVTLRSVPSPGIRIVGFAVGQDGPEDPGVLVGDGDQGLVVTHSSVQCDDPLFESGASEGFAFERNLQR